MTRAHLIAWRDELRRRGLGGAIIKSGVPELVLVTGYSGIGKSAVVNELHKALVPPRGLFASGKFDQHKRDIPYSTLVQSAGGQSSIVDHAVPPSGRQFKVIFSISKSRSLSHRAGRSDVGAGY